MKRKRIDRFNRLAEDIRHRSESKNKDDKTVFERVVGGRLIYPRNKLDQIRLNYCWPNDLHETSHINMYGPNTKSVDLTSLNLPEDKNANLNDIINISNDYDFGEFFSNLL